MGGGTSSPSPGQGFLHAPYLVCRHQVDQHRVEQFLRNSVPLTDDGAHQVNHVHVHLLVMAIADEATKNNNIINNKKLL